MTTDIRTCRLCDENNDHLYNIFEKNVFDIQIINMIKDCLPIVIYRKDPLSKYICHSCNENLNMFVEFKKTCLETANKHREELQLIQEADPGIELYLKQVEEANFNDQHMYNNEQHREEDDEEEEEEHMRQDFSSLQSETSMDYEPIQNNENETLDSEFDPDDTQMTNDTTFNAVVSTYNNHIHPKPRISGPKSVTNAYTRLTNIEEIIYQPLSLLEILVNHINEKNLQDYNSVNWTTEINLSEKILYCCRYCEVMFENEVMLAEHESETHISLSLPKVDEECLWDNSVEGSEIRNAWMKEQKNDEEEDEEEEDDEQETGNLEDEDVDVENLPNDLLVPIKNEDETTENKPELDVSRNSIIYFINEIPYAQGKPLEDIPKETRNTFYQSVKMHGLRRKFCQLCRYTFKDNWSIDTHYFKDNCYYTCNYCGAKFKRNKHEFLPHIKEHEKAGHEKSLSVFASNDRGDVIEYDTSCLVRYVPLMVNQYAPRQMKPVPPKPTPMKLRVRQAPVVKVEKEDTPPPPPPLVKKPQMPQLRSQETNNKKVNINSDLAKNQAYFCKKCYQVFTKLDSYNTHIKTCNGEVINDPEMSLIRHYHRKDGTSPLFCSKVNPQTQQQIRRNNYNRRMPPLTPLPQKKIKRENPECPTPISNNSSPAAVFTNQSFPCHLCPAVFQTVYSRNSHMRIHVRNKESIPKHAQQRQQSQAQSSKRPGSTIMPPAAKKMKPESFEPIVEIHEGSSKVPSSIGSVSITPIKKISNGGTINVSPDIMKLVQNNPNITFKPRDRQEATSSSATLNTSHSSDEGDSKSYKCSSCTQHFANKSNLYFHKKNQCTGSRYPCPFCKKRFGTAAEYSSHIYYSHPE